jgi:hypothetical protein
MRFTIRRAAILAASVALNAFFLLSPAGTVTVSAARCQQECDAEYGTGGSCQGECDANFAYGTDDWWSCHNQCTSWYNSCSMSAVNCYPPNNIYCSSCDVYWDDYCVWVYNDYVWPCYSWSCYSWEC